MQEKRCRFPLIDLLADKFSQYALPINAVVWIFAIVSWFAWGKNKWPGLNVGVIEEVVADGDRDTKE